MPWEIFKRQVKLHGMTAVIYKSKLLSLSNSVIDALKTEHVELLYNKETNKMALKPTKSSSFTYPIRKEHVGVGAISVITIMGFITYFNLEHTIGKHYAVTKENDLFVIDLNKPVSEIRK